MKNKIIFGLAACAVAGLVYAQNQRSLFINGVVASNDVRVINGRAYVPIADIAKAMNMTVVAKGNNFELVRAGGANQVDGLVGKTGEWVFDGAWRFRVDRVYKTDTFNAKNDYYGTTEYTAGEGESFIVVDYSYRNGNSDVYSIAPGPVMLAGKQGNTISVFANDFPFDGNMYFSQGLMPGAEGKGSFIFVLRNEFELKDILVTLGDLTGYDEGKKPKKRSTFRISISL